MTVSRRQFLAGAGAAGALAATGAWRNMARAASPSRGLLLPSPDNSGIEHIVVVMMENRSFDHFLGWMPGADGVQSGPYVDRDGHAYDLGEQLLTGDYNGCAHPDPDHSWEGGRYQLNGGLMNGFASGANDAFAIGHYQESDRPFLSALARNYTALDWYHCSILAETYPNRFFMHSAQTDRLHNGPAQDAISHHVMMPTIWDRLAEKGVSRRYYFGDVPFIGLYGTTYLNISAPYEQFLVDAVAGNLPSVSYVDPRFEDEGSGTSGDDHPHADIRAGDHFLAEIYAALAAGKWNNTVLVVNYDEWGGFYDHVLPPRAANPTPDSVDPDVDVNGDVLLGFRVPCIIASPWTRGVDPDAPRIYGTPQGQALPFDHTSVLKLIEWRYGLAPLTARDGVNGGVGNVIDAFDFANPRSQAADLPLPPPPPPAACANDGPFAPPVPLPDRVPPNTVVRPYNSWTALRESGLLDGWGL